MASIPTLLVTVLLALLAWIGKEANEQLKKIANSVGKIEVELSVLSNDHQNLKDRVEALETK